MKANALPCVYLFSSDQSPLYAQDVLNVLAAPLGQLYTFRYASQYLTEELAAEWMGLKKHRVVVVFSLQQRAEYSSPAFVPIRSGHVVRTYIEGTSHFITFELEAVISLPEPEKKDGRMRYGDAVRSFTSKLADVTTVPYDASASLGRELPVGALDTSRDQTILFDRAGRYLANTAAFANARFVRVLGIKPSGFNAPYVATAHDDPRIHLTAGKTYDLDLYHAQPVAPLAPQPFTVSVDGVSLRTIGRPGFDVSSRYDLVTIRLVAVDTGVEDRETVLVVEPGRDVQGPRVELHIKVDARRRRTFGVAALQTASLFAVALASTMEHWTTTARLVVAGTGSVAAVALGLFGGIPLQAPSLPSPPTDALPRNSAS
jgi:hypothetical protein